MTVVDTLVFGVLAIGLILGLMRGFLSQITGLIGLVGGCYLAWRYQAAVRVGIVDTLFTSEHNDKVAFGAILVVALLVTALASYLLGLLFDKMNMGAYDRLMGGLFGIMKAGLICAGILLALVVLANDGGDVERAIGGSKAGPWIWQVLEKASGALPGEVKGDVQEFLRRNPLPEREEEDEERPETERPPVGNVEPPASAGE